MGNEAVPAARRDDLIQHNQSQLMRLIGQVADGVGTAWIAASLIRKVVLVGSGPAGWAMLGATIVVEWGVGMLIDYAADNLGQLLTGPGIPGIEKGSNNVSINRLPAARGGEQGDPLICHPGKIVREGSKWVSINEKPAARVEDWTDDSGKVITGSPNVFIGGPKVSYDRQSEYQKYIKYAFKAKDLAIGLGTSWADFGQEATKATGDYSMDQLWDFIRGN